MAFKDHAKNPQNWGIGMIIMYLVTNGYINAPKASQTPTNDPAPVYVTMPQVDKRFDERMEVWVEKFKQLQRTADKTDANVERLLLDRRHADAGSKKTKEVAVVP